MKTVEARVNITTPEGELIDSFAVEVELADSSDREDDSGVDEVDDATGDNDEVAKIIRECLENFAFGNVTVMG